MYSLFIEASAIHELIEDPTSVLSVSHTRSTQDHQSILDRLDRIEAALGICQDTLAEDTDSHDLVQENDTESVPLRGLWKAVAHLRSITRPAQIETIWSRPIVERLWSS